MIFFLLGYFLANVCLKLYVIPGMEVTIKEGDPNWIGAWWLGFPVIGTCIVIFAGNFIFLPKKCPGLCKYRPGHFLHKVAYFMKASFRNIFCISFFF